MEVFLFYQKEDKMDLRKLHPSFYKDNVGIKEALDNFNGNWESNKVRGYGVVIISIDSLTFAIPLRSRIKHRAAYITQTTTDRSYRGGGLDYTKALLLTDMSYVSNDLFKIPYQERKKLRNKESFISGRFEKYVQRYIDAIRLDDNNILNSFEYKYTTLINYHDELGINSYFTTSSASATNKIFSDNP